MRIAAEHDPIWREAAAGEETKPTASLAERDQLGRRGKHTNTTSTGDAEEEATTTGPPANQRKTATSSRRNYSTFS